MKRHFFVSIVAIIITFFCLSLFSVSGFNLNNLKESGDAPLVDEVSHIGAGAYYAATGKYFLNFEHPPLIKDVAAIPFWFLEPAFPEITEGTTLSGEVRSLDPQSKVFPESYEVRNAQWDWGRLFLYHPENDPDRLVFWARFSVLLFNTILLFLLFLGITKIWNPKAAILATFLIGFSPLFIANAGIVTTDYSAALLEILTLVTFSIYLRNWIVKAEIASSFSAAIVVFALALLTKFSALLLIPILFIGGSVYSVVSTHSYKKLLPFWGHFILFLVVSFTFVFTFYTFHSYGMNPDHISKFQLEAVYPENFSKSGKEVLDYFIYSTPYFKGVAQYFLGALATLRRLYAPIQDVYFWGNVYGNEGSGWPYFPILMFTKLTLPMLLLIAFGFLFLKRLLWVALKQSWKKSVCFFQDPLLGFLIFFIFSYIFVITFLSSLQGGLRQLLPLIAALFLITGRGIIIYWEKPFGKKLKVQGVTYALCSLSLFVTLFSFPNYFSFYNLGVKYFSKGAWISVDSNYDWGQDIKRLGKWLKENPSEKVYVDVNTSVSLDFYLDGNWELLDIEKEGLPESGSLVVVSKTKFMNNVYDKRISSSNKYNLLEGLSVEKIGETIEVYRTP